MNNQQLILIIGLVLSAAASAHHSTANFDREIVAEISGVVTKFQFMNPHSLIEMQVTDGATGQTKDYSVFATSKVVLLRYGWRPDSVHVGDSISITGHPDREQPSFIYMTGIEFADGTEWFRNEILE